MTSLGKLFKNTKTGKTVISKSNDICVVLEQYEFLSSSEEWTVTHIYNTPIINVQAFVDNKLIYPDSVVVVDDDTIKLIFNESVSGFCNVLFYTSTNCDCKDAVINPTPTPTQTVTPTLTPTMTVTPTVTAAVTPTVTATVSPTVTATVTPTTTVTPTVTPTNTVTPTVTATVTPTSEVTPTVTPTNSVTPTMTLTPTVTTTMTVTPISTVTPTVTPTNTITPTITPTSTVTPTITPTTVFVAPSIVGTDFSVGQNVIIAEAPYPAGNVGDLLLGIFFINWYQKSYTYFTPYLPAGWTQLVGIGQGGSGYDMQHIIMYKTADSVSSGNCTINWPSGGCYPVSIGYRISGANQTPYLLNQHQEPAKSSPNLIAYSGASTLPSVENLIIGSVGLADGIVGAQTGVSPPSWSIDQEQSSTPQSWGVFAACMSKVMSTTDNPGNASYLCTFTSDEQIDSMIGIQPAT